MYTVQALWTQARENLDITTIVFANRAYAILRHELANVGAGNVGRKALDMLDLSRPDIDWVSLAREWACQVSGLRRWTSSTARWSGASPNPGRSSSRR